MRRSPLLAARRLKTHLHSSRSAKPTRSAVALAWGWRTVAKCSVGFCLSMPRRRSGERVTLWGADQPASLSRSGSDHRILMCVSASATPGQLRVLILPLPTQGIRSSPFDKQEDFTMRKFVRLFCVAGLLFALGCLFTGRLFAPPPPSSNIRLTCNNAGVTASATVSLCSDASCTPGEPAIPCAPVSCGGALPKTGKTTCAPGFQPLGVTLWPGPLTVTDGGGTSSCTGSFPLPATITCSTPAGGTATLKASK